jgi:hypothetical protein
MMVQNGLNVRTVQGSGVLLQNSAQVDRQLVDVDLGNGYLSPMKLEEVQNEVRKVLQFFIATLGRKCGETLKKRVIEM